MVQTVSIRGLVHIGALSELIESPALAEDPPTPMWELILEQFKDQLVLILLGSAAVSFVLALFEEGDDWTAFVDPAVVCVLIWYTAATSVLIRFLAYRF